MPVVSFSIRRALLIASVACVAACGGDASAPGARSGVQLAAQEVNAPRASGDVATDGLAWIAYRRQQAGLLAPVRDARLDQAALGHSHYQQQNNRVTHDQSSAEPGFTGATAPDRLRAAGYPLANGASADGEVIAATSATDGFAAAEGLLGAIYHRYLILQPQFDRAGAGSARRDGGYTWLTVNFVASREPPQLGRGQLVVWPAPGQQQVRPNFFSDQETPDPVSGADEVGYPVSVHADIDARIDVERFTLRERGGGELPVKRLAHDSDDSTPESAAAIVPLAPLRGGTSYEVEFSGRVDGVAVQRSWSFTTR